MTRYRILIAGRLTARLTSNLGGVELEPHDEGTAVLVDVTTATELDRLLHRLGDLGLEVVSVTQEPA